MIAKIIFILICFPATIQAQSIEPIDSILSLIIYNNKTLLQEQINMLHQYKEKNALSLLPTIGYDLVTNRPLVNFSFTNFISMHQRKMDLKFQSLQLKARSLNQLINDTITCKLHYQELNELLENYNGQLALLDSSSQLLQIKMDENKKLQATSEDVLRVQLELERLRLSVNQTKSEITAKALQLSLLIKRRIRYKLT